MRSASSDARGAGAGAQVRIAVLAYPRIANFDDLDPLRAEPDVDLVFVRPGAAAAGRRRAGHPARLEGDHRRSRRRCAQPAGTSTSRPIVRRGGRVLGICGGYQMLGRTHRRSARPAARTGIYVVSQQISELMIRNQAEADELGGFLLEFWRKNPPPVLEKAARQFLSSPPLGL